MSRIILLEEYGKKKGKEERKSGESSSGPGVPSL